MEGPGLTALTALVKTFSTGVVGIGTKGDLEGFVGEILTGRIVYVCYTLKFLNSLSTSVVC